MAEMYDNKESNSFYKTEFEKLYGVFIRSVILDMMNNSLARKPYFGKNKTEQADET